MRDSHTSHDTHDGKQWSVRAFITKHTLDREGPRRIGTERPRCALATVAVRSRAAFHLQR